MKKKLAALLVFVAVVALASMGMSYAADKDVFFIGCGAWDCEVEKDVGNVSAHIDSMGDLNISVSNAYPGYEACVNFTIKYTAPFGGDERVYLTEIDITNNFPSVMDIIVTGIAVGPTPIHQGEKLEGLLTITIKDGAEEDQPYWFDVDIKFEDVPP